MVPVLKGKIYLKTQGTNRVTVGDTEVNISGNIVIDGTGSVDGNPFTSDDRIKINERLLPENTTELLMKIKPEIYDMLKYDRSVNLSNIENPTFDMRVVGSSNYLGTKEQSIRTDNFGIIAQELYTIPELRSLVHPSEDSDFERIQNTQIYNGDGGLNERENWYEEQGWGVKDISRVEYVGLIPVLIKGFQEQQTLISSLKERIDALEANNN